MQPLTADACGSGDFNCIATQCSGGAGVGTDLFQYWASHDCPGAYAQILNTTNNQLAYNPSAQVAVQEQVLTLFNNYLSTNTLTDDVTASGYSTFQNTLISLCTAPELPGVCQLFLTGTTGGFTGATGATGGYCASFDRNTVINSPTLTSFCGCYVAADSTYLSYTQNPTCDPLCHRARTSQRADIETGALETCNQDVCVIDQVVINAANSSVENGVNFTSFCGGCGGATGGTGCLCIINGVNVNQTIGTIGLTPDFSEFCGPNSVCIQNGTVIPCNPGALEAPAVEARPNWGIVGVMLLLLVIVVIAIIAYRYVGD